MNVDPYQADYSPIAGIDLSVLKRDRIYQLTDEQMDQLVRDIYKNDINEINSYNQLAINVFSIASGKKKYVVCYRNVSFDPSKKSLILGAELRFNKSFMVDGKKRSIFSYINMDADEFAATFEEKYDEYREVINANLKYGETIES